MVDQMLSAPTEALFIVEPVKETKLPPARPHGFNTILCAECGQVAVERCARVKDGKSACTPCAGQR